MQEENKWLSLPSDLKRRIFWDKDLEKRDRLALNLTCRNYRDIVRHDLLKEKIYSKCIIADGLLDSAIFKEFPLDYQYVYEQISRINPKVFKLSARLDYKHVWPLVAFLGMENALIKLIGNDPLQRDDNHYNALTWLALGGHKDVLIRWIERCYNNNFSPDKEPKLLKMAVYSGSHELTRYLHEERLYEFDWFVCSDTEDEFAKCYSEIHDVLRCGHIELFWKLFKEKGQEEIGGIPLALTAAKYHHWDVCDALIEQGCFFEAETDISVADLKVYLVAYAARDDHQRFLSYFPDPNDLNLREFEIEDQTIDLITEQIDDQTVYAFAVEGGHLETVTHIYRHGYGSCSDCSGEADVLDIAAKYGQISIIDSLHDEIRERNHDQARIYHLFNYAALYGDWNKYQYLIRKYPPGNSLLNDRLSEDFVNEFSDETQSDLHRAIENGHIYFAQRFIQKYGDKLLLGKSGEKLIESAKMFDRPVVYKWVEEQIEAAQLRLEKAKVIYK